MIVYVLGSTGMLGRYMFSYMSKFHNCKGLSREQFDAAAVNQDYLNSKIKKGDVVINCVGVLKPNINRVGVTSTIMINSTFPQVVADICSSNNAHFIHISSDCIYTGNKGMYTEDDTGDADDVYARTKSIEPKNSSTIRTSFVGEEHNNSNGVGIISWLMMHASDTIDGYTNCLWNGVSCLQLCKYIKSVIDNNHFQTGIRHVHSRDIISKYELCCIIDRVYGLNINIRECHAKEISGTTINGMLDRSLASKYKLPLMPSIEEQITTQQDYEI
jgi:dTDP-4-dehydrorhamnose reductase